MPEKYSKPEDLPEAVREHLPEHAQHIYLQAFNSAWEEYADPRKRRGKASQEETAHRVAWAAVKSEYRKRGDQWVPKTRRAQEKERRE